jgi:superfamily II DNA or RNA helicase
MTNFSSESESPPGDALQAGDVVATMLIGAVGTSGEGSLVGPGSQEELQRRLMPLTIANNEHGYPFPPFMLPTAVEHVVELDGPLLELIGGTDFEEEDEPDVDPDVQRKADFLESIQSLEPGKEMNGFSPRDYQVEAIENFKEGVLSGNNKGKVILGMGGGKTTIAMNIIAQTKGRVLYIGPRNIAVNRAVDEVKMRGIERSNKRLTSVLAPNDDWPELSFATAQLFTHSKRFLSLPRDHFDLIIFDEAHGMMGEQMRKISGHFTGAQLHMTATPRNTSKSLSRLVPDTWQNYDNDQLIKNHGYPEWVLCRAEVTGETPSILLGIKRGISFGVTEEGLLKIEESSRAITKEDCAEIMPADQIETLEVDKATGCVRINGKNVKVLNMSHRYQACSKILKEAMEKNPAEKGIGFLPSVISAKNFVEEIIWKNPEHPEWKEQVQYVDGSMSKKKQDKIQRDFESGKVKWVFCKDIWNESLDVDDIMHVVLADPTTSESRMMQRIGRGARKSEGKNHLFIHDVVSALQNVGEHKGNTKQRKTPKSATSLFNVDRAGKKTVLNGENAGKILEASTNNEETIPLYQETSSSNSHPIRLRERNIKLKFMRNPQEAMKAFKALADALDTSLENLLVFAPEEFLKTETQISIEFHDGYIVKAAFADLYESAILFCDMELLQAMAFKAIFDVCSQTHDRLVKVVDEGIDQAHKEIAEEKARIKAERQRIEEEKRALQEAEQQRLEEEERLRQEIEQQRKAEEEAQARLETERRRAEIEASRAMAAAIEGARFKAAAAQRSKEYEGAMAEYEEKEALNQRHSADGPFQLNRIPHLFITDEKYRPLFAYLFRKIKDDYEGGQYFEIEVDSIPGWEKEGFSPKEIDWLMKMNQINGVVFFGGKLIINIEGNNDLWESRISESRKIVFDFDGADIGTTRCGKWLDGKPIHEDVKKNTSALGVRDCPIELWTKIRAAKYAGDDYCVIPKQVWEKNNSLVGEGETYETTNIRVMMEALYNMRKRNDDELFIPTFESPEELPNGDWKIPIHHIQINGLGPFKSDLLSPEVITRFRLVSPNEDASANASNIFEKIATDLRYEKIEQNEQGVLRYSLSKQACQMLSEDPNPFETLDEVQEMLEANGFTAQYNVNSPGSIILYINTREERCIPQLRDQEVSDFEKMLRGFDVDCFDHNSLTERNASEFKDLWRKIQAGLLTSRIVRIRGSITRCSAFKKVLEKEGIYVDIGFSGKDTMFEINEGRFDITTHRKRMGLRKLKFGEVSKEGGIDVLRDLWEKNISRHQGVQDPENLFKGEKIAIDIFERTARAMLVREIAEGGTHLSTDASLDDIGAEIGNSNIVEEMMKQMYWLESMLRMVGVDIEFGTTQVDGMINVDLSRFKWSGVIGEKGPAIAPSGIFLHKIGDKVQLEGVRKRFPLSNPFDLIGDVALCFPKIYDALAQGQDYMEVELICDSYGEVQDFDMSLGYVRRYLESFGFQGDLLQVIMPFPACGEPLKISLAGLRLGTPEEITTLESNNADHVEATEVMDESTMEASSPIDDRHGWASIGAPSDIESLTIEHYKRAFDLAVENFNKGPFSFPIDEINNPIASVRMGQYTNEDSFEPGDVGERFKTEMAKKKYILHHMLIGVAGGEHSEGWKDRAEKIALDNDQRELAEKALKFKIPRLVDPGKIVRKYWGWSKLNRDPESWTEGVGVAKPGEVALGVYIDAIHRFVEKWRAEKAAGIEFKEGKILINGGTDIRKSLMFSIMVQVVGGLSNPNWKADAEELMGQRSTQSMLWEALSRTVLGNGCLPSDQMYIFSRSNRKKWETKFEILDLSAPAVAEMEQVDEQVEASVAEESPPPNLKTSRGKIFIED